MDTEQLKGIRERLDGADPGLDFFVSVGGLSAWAVGQVVNRDIRFHNAAYADVKALLTEVENLQNQRDQAERRSSTWRDLYGGKRQQIRLLLDSVRELVSIVAAHYGIPAEDVGRIIQVALTSTEKEDRIAETMEAIEDVLEDPVLKNRGWLSHQPEENGQ